MVIQVSRSPVGQCSYGSPACHPTRRFTQFGAGSRFTDRCATKARCLGERSVFQMEPPRGETSIASVREAYEACAMYVDANGKRQCYALFGLDADRMDRYYHTVMDLEKALELDNSAAVTAPQRSHPTIGFFKLFSSLLVAFVSFLFYLVTSIFTVKTPTRKLVLK